MSASSFDASRTAARPVQRLRLGTALLAASLAAPIVPLHAAEPPKLSLTAFPLVSAVILDGVLDDAAWTVPPGATGFVQQTPAAGSPAAGHTTVWAAYDDHALYLAAKLDDPDPELIQADERHRDASLSRSDAFAVLIDAYHDHQTGFLFETNPLAAQSDRVISREGAFVNTAWNGIWDVASARTATGWSVEFRIPFATLRFHPEAGAVWGVQFRRVIPHLRETAFWNPLTSEQTLEEVSRSGHLRGIEPIARGGRLSVVPYAKGAYGTRTDSLSGWDVDHAAGADLRYLPTSDLTLDLTANTDFAETEADRFQVRLDRFPLFFPERREFFLEGKGAYEFGLAGTLQPFFSRRIGLRGGEPIPLWGGGKLTGKVDRYGIGLLAMQSRADDGGPAERFGVLRLTRDLGVRSQLGGIATRRDPIGGSASQTVGLDATYNPTSTFTTDGFWLRSDGNDRPGYAAFAQAQYRDPLWRLKLSQLRVDERFDPQLGFVRQTDLEETVGYIDVRPRPAAGPVLEWGAKSEITYQTTTDGRLLYRSQYQRVLAEFRSGDTILLSWDPQFERLLEPFVLREADARRPEPVVIPAGDYRYHHWNVYVNTESSRPISGVASVLWGGYYGGRKTSLDLQLTVAVLGAVSLGGSLSVDWIRLPQADVVARIVAGDARWSVTNRLVVSALVQHDEESRTLAGNVRLAWEYRTGSYLYLIANPSSNPDRTASVFLAKWTWRWENR